MKANLNKCVDANGGGSSNGTNIQIWDCNGSDAQKFEYNKLGQIFYAATGTGKCIDINGTNRSTTDLNGTNIQLWDCNSGTAQAFDMVVGGGTGIPIWVPSTSLAKRGENVCIDRNNNGTANGTNIQVWDCNNSQAQLFSYNKIDGTIRAVNNPSLCMDVWGGKTDNGTNVQVWQCNSGDAQRFDFDLETGEIRLRKAPNKCLDIQNGGQSSSSGTNIQLWDCNGTSAQKFDLRGGTKTGQVQRLSIELRNIDDDFTVLVNEQVRVRDWRPRLVQIDPAWLVYGDNSIRIVLGNGGCGTSSLTMALFRNMESTPAITRGIYRPNLSSCHALEADWRYTFNTATGRIRETQ